MKYEKLRTNMYGAHLIYGNIDLNPTHTFTCFFIVRHIENEDYIRKQAIQLLLTGCRNFHFLGDKEQIWCNGFSAANIMFNPHSIPEKIAYITGWSTMDDFVKELYISISVRSIVPHDTYLLYDDRETYEEVLKRLDTIKPWRGITRRVYFQKSVWVRSVRWTLWGE